MIQAFLRSSGVAAATGARRSELLALRWSDIDEVSSRVTIARGLVNGPDGFVVKDTKTYGVRRVALDPKTAEVLAEHRRRAENAAEACRVVMSLDAYVFSHEADSSVPWRPDQLPVPFACWCSVRAPAACACTISGITSRPACWLPAWTCAQSPVGSATATLSTTLNVYAHFVVDADEEAAAVLARRLDQGGAASTKPTT